MERVECVYHDKAILGEGIFWSEGHGKWYWVDIEGERLCRFDLASGSNESVAMGQPIGTAVECATGELIVGLKDGVYLLDFESGRKRRLCDPMAGDVRNRLNDGKAGPDGRLYIGGIGPDREQSLYRIERDGTRFETLLSGVSCSNGLCWSRGGAVFYYIDSLARTVDAFDFDADTGSIRNRRVVVDLQHESSVPDGMTIDHDGKLWVAIWGGGCVRRYDPNTGREIFRIELPVSKVTSCAFGGADGRDLLITTASVGFEGDDWKREPLAGGLFRYRAVFSGSAPNRFCME